MRSNRALLRIAPSSTSAAGGRGSSGVSRSTATSGRGHLDPAQPGVHMLEFYEAYRDYHYLMDLTEACSRGGGRRSWARRRSPTRARRSTSADRSTALRWPRRSTNTTRRIRWTSSASPIPARRARAVRRRGVPDDGLGLLQLKPLRGNDRGGTRAADVHRRAPDRRLAARARERRQSGP